MIDIPNDLHDFLAEEQNRYLTFKDCELEEVTLFAPGELTESRFPYRSASRRKTDIRGIDLVKDCPTYHPAGILIWFSCLGLYGTWDGDHEKIIVFTQESWTDIMQNPARFFCAQWNPGGANQRVL